jgi:hypothetical protein
MDSEILAAVKRADRHHKTVILSALLTCHLPAAMIYAATVGHELVTYYGQDGIKDGIHYGLIALTLLRLSPAALLLGAVVLGLETLSTVNGCRSWLTVLAFDFVVSVIVLAIVGPGLLTDLTSLSSTQSQLNIENRVYYAVEKVDGDQGVHCYLLACEGALGECRVLGSIQGPFPVSMAYIEQLRTIIVQNAAEERQAFSIGP